MPSAAIEPSCRASRPFTLMLATLLVTTGCGRIGAGDPDTTTTDPAAAAAQVRRSLEALPPEDRARLTADRAALERFVRGELLRREILAEAQAARLDSDPAVRDQLERLREDALVRLWVARQAVVPDSYPSADDLKVAYQANAEALAPPTRYRVAQIFVAAPNGIEPARLAVALRKAAEVGSRIPAGDFADLARRYSEHAASAANGGDVGMLPADQILPEILATVRGMGVGAIAGPIKTSQGLHYVRLLEREDAPAPSLEDSRARLAAALRTQRGRDLEQAYLAALDARLDLAVGEITLAQLDAPGDPPGKAAP